MNLKPTIEYIRNLFDFWDSYAKKKEATEIKEIVRQIVAKYSRESVSLQQGNYITEDDIEYLRNIVNDHDFCKHIH